MIVHNGFVRPWKTMIDYTAKKLKNGTSNDTTGTKLPPEFFPGDYDVICGRGAMAYNHVGNRRFRVSVSMLMQQYSEAETKLDKSMIVSIVVNGVRERSPFGGFVKMDNGTGQWYEVGDHLAREKVGQAFRDALHNQYRSSTKAKSKRKRAEKRESIRSSSSKSDLDDESTRASLDSLLEDMMRHDTEQPDAAGNGEVGMENDSILDTEMDIDPLPFRLPEEADDQFNFFPGER